MFHVVKAFRKLFGPWVTAPPPRPKPRPSFKPTLEALEERWCPALNTTTWQPQAGSQDGNNAANYTNGLPNANTMLVLTGGLAATNKPIEFSKPITVAGIGVSAGYNNDLIIDNGATVSVVTGGANGGVNVLNGCTLTITSADASGISLSNVADFTVQNGGTLKLTDPAGAAQGGTFISPGDPFGEELVNQGTVTWTGTAVAAGQQLIADSLDVPVINTGTFNANGGTGGQVTVTPGTLNLLGETSNSNVSFSQTAGSCNLSNLATVVVQYGYYQSGGLLTSDSTQAGKFDLLQAGGDSTGDINIAGGKVVVDNVANSIGTLKFAAGTVEFLGELDVSGQTLPGGNSTVCDLLDCGSAQVTLGDSSYIWLRTVGSDPLGTGNQWVLMKYGSINRKWPVTQAPTGINFSTGAAQTLASN